MTEARPGGPGERPGLIDRQRAADAARPRRRWPWAAGGLVLLAALWVSWGNDLAIALESDAPSRSIGTPADGRLENGKRLPSRGRNFRAYSDLGTALGRAAVHQAVRDTVVQAYATLAERRPGTWFVYGETGWPGGGPLRPHRTHQNGMAVDFFVPVLDGAGRSRPLPTPAWRKFGYGIEFDDAGRWGGYRIDFPALAAHLGALDAAARAQGLGIAVVIFDNALQDQLFATPEGAALRRQLPFSRSRPWVRHDEHYHVVFRERR